MGSSLYNCFKEDKNVFIKQKFSHIYPDQIISVNVNTKLETEDKFIHIPKMKTIDKTIESCESKHSINETQFEAVQAALNSLFSIKNKIFSKQKTILFTSSIIQETNIERGSVDNASISTISSPNVVVQKKPKRYLTADFNSNSLQPANYQITEGFILLEIQEGLFIHPEELKRKNMCKPFVNIKIAPIKEGEFDVGKDIYYNTNEADSAINPQWNELFENHFLEMRDLREWQITFILNYRKKKTQKLIRIGEEQTFLMNSLLDQKVHERQIEFKEFHTKGIIAKLVVRFQFIYNFEELNKKLHNEIDNRIGRLQRYRHNYYKNNNYLIMNTTPDKISKQAISPSLRQSNDSVIFESYETKYYIT